MDEGSPSERWWVPFLQACWEGDDARIHKLLPAVLGHGNAALRADILRRATVVAVHSHNGALLDFLVAQGATTDGRDDYGDSLLALAAEIGDLAMVTKLVTEYGADVMSVGKRGQSPVHAAAAGGCAAIIDLLVERGGANPNVVDAEGWTPLQVANWKNKCDAVDLLLRKYNADVRAKEQNSRTSLHFAAAAGNLVNIRALLDAGAADMTHAEDRYGVTPLREAVGRGHVEAAKLLLSAAGLPREPSNLLELVARQNSIQMLTLLLMLGVPASPKPHRERAPLMEAAASSSVEATETLLAFGADLMRDAEASGRRQTPPSSYAHFLLLAGVAAASDAFVV